MTPKSNHPSRLTAVMLALTVALAARVGPAAGDTSYQKPPTAILDILGAPAPPQVLVSPARDSVLLVDVVRYPTIGELARPMLRLAGLRINPSTNGPHRSQHAVGLTLVRVADGSSMKVQLPPNPQIGLNTPSPAAGGRLRGPQRPSSWSADGRYIAFTQTTPSGIELWVLEVATAAARRMPGVTINAAYGEPLQWMPDQRTLLVQTVPAGRVKAPTAPVPRGARIQENLGKKAPVWTFQDLLQNAHDEDLFDYFATSQLAAIDVRSGRSTPIGKPAIFQTLDPSPDGKALLVARLHRPYSYLIPHDNFPKEVEVWDAAGNRIHTVASLGLQEQVPNNGVPVGPREYGWHPAQPATLVWAEALDEGNPRNRVAQRDRILTHPAPFSAPARELARTEYRFTDLQWIEGTTLALVEEYDRSKRWRRVWLIDEAKPAAERRKVWDLSEQDHYGNPGRPVIRLDARGRRVVARHGDAIHLTGVGGSPEGDRPFLDALDLGSLASRRLFRSDDATYESVLTLVEPDGSKVLTRRESKTEPPNVYLRRGSDIRALSRYADPTPELRQVRSELVTYTRPDGVQLQFTLYLPAGYRDGDRLPTVIWAYPREYTDPKYASQVSGSPHRFLSIEGASHLFFLTQGYAVLDSATMPVVGDSENVNNTYVEQIVASAKAAIDKAAAIGVCDPKRVGVGGHSYGAFMTANLLTHSELFRAGIARSGAYNRTLTPFGFQQELRTLWEAPELYFKMSPFLHVPKIQTPILLIHGEADNNSGTFPMQSERYYHALKGNGKTVRYVTLPLESHGYAARESIEHTLYEMLSWFERYVKSPGASTGAPTSGRAER